LPTGVTSIFPPTTPRINFDDALEGAAGINSSANSISEFRSWSQQTSKKRKESAELEATPPEASAAIHTPWYNLAWSNKDVGEHEKAVEKKDEEGKVVGTKGGGGVLVWG